MGLALGMMAMHFCLLLKAVFHKECELASAKENSISSQPT